MMPVVTGNPQAGYVPAPPVCQTTLDRKELRNALGTFATGVCVVTTQTRGGVDAGLTANSFTSVSLDPPLILWSLAKTSSALDSFRSSTHFAVHVLGVEQEDVSLRFATRGIDRFAGAPVDRSVEGVPLLSQYAARFECKLHKEYEGGDHLIFVGEVLRFSTSGTEPLVFHGGRYAEVVQTTQALPTPAPHSPLAPTDLSYLIWRAFLQFRRKYYQRRLQMFWTETDSYILQVLAMNEGQTVEELGTAIEFTGHTCTAANIQSLKLRGLVEEFGDDSRINLTPTARDLVRELSTLARSVEDEVLSAMTKADARRLKHLLRSLIEKTAGVTP